MTDEWTDPAESASDWLEEATAPWRERIDKPTTDQLLWAAQVAALLAIQQTVERLVPTEAAED